MRVLVTGAASGIGAAVADLFTANGAQVFRADLAFTDSDQQFALDITSEAAWQSVLQRVGPLDALVACAGISMASSIDSTSLEAWRQLMAVNLDGAFLSIQHGARAMAGRGGAIVVIGSASGVKAVAQASAYCASKAAVRMLVRTAALEYKPAGIRVNCVSPAGVVTPMWSKMPFFQSLVEQHGEAGAWEALGGADPETPSLQRMAMPREVADAVWFLCSPASAHITGIDLPVDAGYSL